ncbi:HicB family protein [archaeon]|nr:HicB family protein [archaeon]|tara:strand:- start:724 stop:951 length:228 start_codon:yes stop_codon:yes gene_type:complete
MEKKILNYVVLIEQDENGVFVAKVPDIPGCYTQGKTVQEVMERVREAIDVCLKGDQALIEVPMKFVGLQQIEIKR